MSKTNDLKKYFYVFFQLRQRLRGAWHVQLRAVIEKLVANYQKYYTASKYVTVDEQVHPFRWRCGFRVYMPKKPSKYGTIFVYFVFCLLFFLYVWPAFCHAIIKRILMIVC